MRKALWMIGVLVIVGLLSGAALSSIYRYTRPLIEANKKRELEEAIYKVLPQAARYEPIDRNGIVIYKGIRPDGDIAGYAFKANGPGYQGDISVMVGIDRRLGKLMAIEILDSLETPGLGGKITDDVFKEQFKSLSVSPKIRYVKNRAPQEANEIQAITGATISSRSLVSILNNGIAKAKEALKR